MSASATAFGTAAELPAVLEADLGALLVVDLRKLRVADGLGHGRPVEV